RLGGGLIHLHRDAVLLGERVDETLQRDIRRVQRKLTFVLGRLHQGVITLFPLQRVHLVVDLGGRVVLLLLSAGRGGTTAAACEQCCRRQNGQYEPHHRWTPAYEVAIR